jgi:hypothetical protein
MLDITLEPSRQASLTGLLREFWSAIERGDDRLATLTAWAQLRPARRANRSQHAIRREHNLQRLASRWKGKPCFVCSELASQEHHIVQIQHGGTNRPDNKVRVCTACHGKIHPFLKPVSRDIPAGHVPYMLGTETIGRCPACNCDVIFVQPVRKKLRYVMAQSSRLIPLQLSATAPYTTADLHQQFCLNKRGYGKLTAADLGRSAKRDIRWAEQHG